ncbi:MAG: GHMP kinase [Anaerolineae bacterium]|nr:GHMP kinase [Anaerolineae bacterium]
MFERSGRRPLRVINSVAPIRICDNGGWTDTWFAEYGKVFNIGVYPYVEVQIEVYPYERGEERIILYAENYGERYAVHPEQPGWDRHPLLEAAIERMGVPKGYAIQATIFSEAPSGCSTGTSAAVAVALIGALDRLTPGQLSLHQVAYTAHAVEVEMLKQQSGIQDQLCSAYGGINYIDIFKYPYASVSQIYVSNAIWWELERRLALIYLGKSHVSSHVHEKVIAELKSEGPDTSRLQDLRKTAEQARDAVYAGDFVALGQSMIENTAAQGRLHPDLVSQDALKIIESAKRYGAVGWKVNGAGGEGGSVTILGPALSYTKREMLREIETANPLFKNIPVYLSRYGLRIWEQEWKHKGG